MPSNSRLSRHHRRQLLDLARASIVHGLSHGVPLPVDAEQFAVGLQAPRAVFVTLMKSGLLRGCIGTLEADAPLVVNVARQAYAAAFRDHRFPRLTAEELDGLEIHLSILSPSEEIRVASEEDLIAKLRPGIDGVTLVDGSKRGTFLPAVWDSLPEPEAFLLHLKEKTGLPAHYWSPTLRVYRYTADVIDDDALADQG